MRYFIKNIVCLIVAFSSFWGLSQKPMRVGYIDIEYILDHLDEYKIANEQFALKVQQWEREIAQRKWAIDSLKNALETEKPLLTLQLIKDKEQEIAIWEHQLKAYQQKRFGADGDYINQRISLVKPVQDQVFNIAQQIGKLNSYDYIVDKSELNLYYSSDRHDLTQTVLKVLNKEENKRDRERNVFDLLKENFNFDALKERDKQKSERDKVRKVLEEEKRQQREEKYKQILKEREERAKQRELQKQAQKQKNNN